MISKLATALRSRALAVGLVLAATAGSAPLGAQGIQTVDPDAAIDGDLSQPQPQRDYDYDVPSYESDTQELPPAGQSAATPPASTQPVASPQAASPDSAQTQQAAATTETYQEDDLIGAAEGVFGKGAEGLARLIENILDEQGEPNAYIVGREGGGAFVLGVRYGSGTLYHKVEGSQPIYWTGPSIGFDAGANAGSTFVLVYNLFDTEELYERYPAGEGQAYLVGGFNASYMRKGDVVLIPIRVGAGLRLGVNAGYMKFSHKQRWLPF